jgi:KipI family sensor histidine kinase inhibitor
MRVLRAGRRALLLECAAGDVPAWYRFLLDRRAAGLLAAEEIVPAAQTVLLDGVAEPGRVAAELGTLRAPGPAAEHQPRPAATVDIPTVYDGPDLDDVAGLWDTDRAGVLAVHAGTRFTVAFCGFAPGFAYLTGLPRRYHVPRRATPRTRVPAGTVALAGEFGAVYPTASPGGWQCIGRTDLVLFDLDADPPALLVPGTQVRFVPLAVR